MPNRCRKHVSATGHASWRVRVELPRRWVDGVLKRRQVTVVEPTRAACEARQLDLLAHGEEGERPAVTLGEALERQRATRDGVVAYATLANYAKADRRLPGWLRGMALGEIRPEDLERARRELRAGYAAHTARFAWRRLRAALLLAVDRGWLATDPSRRVTAPAPPDEESGRAVTGEDLERLGAALDADRWCGLWWLMVGAGLRVGEALALRWGDVDRAGLRAHVRRTVTRGASGEEIRETTKTRQARWVKIDAAILAAMDRQRAGQAGEAPERWVCAQPTGERITYDQARKRIALLSERAGVGRVSCHDLRRTFATGWGDLWGSPRLIADQLGHRGISMTARYQRPPLESRAAITEEWTKRLKGD